MHINSHRTIIIGLVFGLTAAGVIASLSNRSSAPTAPQLPKPQAIEVTKTTQTSGTLPELVTGSERCWKDGYKRAESATTGRLVVLGRC